MKHEEKFPVEPLSEAAWARIEQAVLERAQVDAAPAEAARPLLTRRFTLTLGAVAAVQLAAAVFLLLSNMKEPTLAPLASTRIVTEHDATETLFGDVSIRVDPASALVALEAPAAGSLVVLERGAAHFSVPPRKARPAFSVQAGAVRVEVVGTRFRVHRSAAAVSVETFEGTVRVIAGSRITLLGAGESWTDAPPPARARTDPPPAPTPEVALTPTPPTPAVGGSRRAPRPPTAIDGARARFEQAALLEASRPGAALRLYARLAAEGGPWGQTALYAQGRLELELGHESNAARLLKRYLMDHPTGANAADVRTLLAQLPAWPVQEDK